MRIRFKRERERTFGAWKDEDYKGFLAAEDVAEYITSIRSEDEWRKSACEDDA